MCLSLKEHQAIMGPHLGDLDDLSVRQQLLKSSRCFNRSIVLRPKQLPLMLIPNYISHQMGKQLAEQQHIPVIEVPPSPCTYCLLFSRAWTYTTTRRSNWYSP